MFVGGGTCGTGEPWAAPATGDAAGWSVPAAAVAVVLSAAGWEAAGAAEQPAIVAATSNTGQRMQLERHAPSAVTERHRKTAPDHVMT